VLRGVGFDGKLNIVLYDFSATRFMPVTQVICEKAVALTKRYGKQVYGYDAIHLATALKYIAEAFVANDKALLNVYVKGVDIRALQLPISISLPNSVH